MSVDIISRIEGKKSQHQTNRFDISAGRKFTAPVGALLPIYYRELVPGNHISLNITNLTRTFPMASANYGRITENFDVYFVPFRLLAEGIQPMLAGSKIQRLTSANSIESVPHMSNADVRSFISDFNTNQIKDDAGISASLSSARLLECLGYGFNASQGRPYPLPSAATLYPSSVDTFSEQASNNSKPILSAVNSDDISYSILPCLAYQKIYQDYFRNKYWEKENYLSYFCPASYQVSDLADNGVFDLQYSNFDKDRIFGMMPDTNGVFTVGINAVNTTAMTNHLDAYGKDSVLDSNASVPSDSLLSSVVASLDGLSGQDISNRSDIIDSLKGSGVDFTNPQSKAALVSAFKGLSALNIHRMEALQRFAEISALNKDDYKHQMSAHFGINVPDLNSDYCTYVGGKSQPVVISDVACTSSTDYDSTTNGQVLGSLAGRGTVFGKSGNIDYTALEHGYIMVIYHLQPHIDYINRAIDPQLLRFDRYDFQIPEFGDLGFEPVRLASVLNSSVWGTSEQTGQKYFALNPNLTLGYLPRYYSYKTDIDTCSGAFSDDLHYGVGSMVIPFDIGHFMVISGQTTPSSLSNFKLDYRFFKVYPSIVDKLFYVYNDGKPSTDQFIVDSNISAIVDLPLSVDGLPY